VNLSLRSVELFGFGGEDYLVPYQGRPYVAWQGGTPEFPYCVPDATRNATWGAVKALYR
jgi:hypothetical protein